MRRISLGLLLLMHYAFADSMHSSQSEGSSLARQSASQAPKEMKAVDSKNFVPHDMENQTFDPNDARERALSNIVPPSPTTEFLRSEDVQNNEIHFEDDDYLFKNSNEIVDDATSGQLTTLESEEFTIETCKQAVAPYPISLIRTLTVHVTCHPDEKEPVKVCSQHDFKKEYLELKKANKKARKLRESFASDPSIKSSQVVGPKKCGNETITKYLVTAHWSHHDNAVDCNSYQTQLKVTKAQWWEEIGDEWLFEDPSHISYFKNPDCTLFERTCLDDTPSKIIDGKEVKRHCWKEKITLLCALKNNQDCLSLKEKNCELIKKTCLLNSPQGCSLWELTYRCHSKVLKRKIECEGLFGLDEDLWQVEYDPNTSFSDVTMKLAVFEQMQNDIQASQEADPRRVQIFQGKAMTCSKNVSDKTMYDCCFTHSGIAKELGLATCSADEIALAEMREKGLCHYVGSHPVKLLDLWKSRDEHVFCCFASKLARVFQEQARDQLRISWGEPKHANPRGLSIDELSHLDFSKLDLREAFTDIAAQMTPKLEGKLESFQKRVQQKIEEEQQEQEKNKPC